MVRLISFYSIFLSLLFTTGCKSIQESSSNYTPEKIVQKVISNCKKEYGMDLDAKVIGNTLFIYLQLDDIILTTRFLSTKSLEKINNVSLVASRAGLSASKDIHFYTVIATDSKNFGVQLVINQYVKDIKKFMLGLISRNDYIQRTEMHVEFNPVLMGKNIIRSFFKKMKTFSTNAMISSFFPKNLTLHKISPFFFSTLMEHNLKTDRNYQILKMKTHKISKNECLIYTEVKESYKPLPKYVDHKFLFPQEHISQYLFVINTNFLPKIIENIYSLQKFDSKKKKLVYTGFPPKYKKFKNIEFWSKHLPPKTQSVEFFVVRQILNQIRKTFLKDNKFNKLFVITSLKGNYIEDKETNESLLHFKIDIDRHKTKESLSLMNNYYLSILKNVITIIVDLVYSFEFKNFDKVKIDYIPRNKTIILDAKLIEKFYKNRITVKDIIPSSF